MPAGSDGSRKELRVYENVFAIVQNGGKPSQVQIGTLIQVGDAWRLVDAPAVAEGQAESAPAGFFFLTAMANRPAAAAAGAGSEEGQKFLSALEKLDPLSPERPDLLEQLAHMAKTPEDRAMWYRQMADTISAAVQSKKSSDGDKRLEALFHKLQSGDGDKALAAYVRFRQLNAQYDLGRQPPRPTWPRCKANG